jgi:hypothetical protein
VSEPEILSALHEAAERCRREAAFAFEPAAHRRFLEASRFYDAAAVAVTRGAQAESDAEAAKAHSGP